MGYTREKKIKLFLQVGGKCEYCKCDMVFCLANGLNYENEATFDHLYNRDHELRNAPQEHGERRIFLVCRKCNAEKSKIEPNKQEPNGVEKTIQKLVPKEKWTDEKYINRITKVLEEERELSKEIGTREKQIRKLKHEKTTFELKLGKKTKYRNLLLTMKEENQLQTYNHE